MTVGFLVGKRDAALCVDGRKGAFGLLIKNELWIEETPPHILSVFDLEDVCNVSRSR